MESFQLAVDCISSLDEFYIIIHQFDLKRGSASLCNTPSTQYPSLKAMRPVYLLSLAALLAAASVPAFAYEIIIITELGNTFVVREVGMNDAGDDGSGGGTSDESLRAVLSAMPTSARIVELDPSGTVIYGHGKNVKMISAVPYLELDDGYSYAALTSLDTASVKLDGAFGYKVEYRPNTEEKWHIIDRGERLAYKVLFNEMGATIQDIRDGLRFSGDGTVLVQLSHPGADKFSRFELSADSRYTHIETYKMNEEDWFTVNGLADYDSLPAKPVSPYSFIGDWWWYEAGGGKTVPNRFGIIGDGDADKYHMYEGAAIITGYGPATRTKIPIPSHDIPHALLIDCSPPGTKNDNGVHPNSRVDWPASHDIRHLNRVNGSEVRYLHATDIRGDINNVGQGCQFTLNLSYTFAYDDRIADLLHYSVDVFGGPQNRTITQDKAFGHPSSIGMSTPIWYPDMEHDGRSLGTSIFQPVKFEQERPLVINAGLENGTAEIRGKIYDRGHINRTEFTGLPSGTPYVVSSNGSSIYYGLVPDDGTIIFGPEEIGGNRDVTFHLFEDAIITDNNLRPDTMTAVFDHHNSKYITIQKNATGPDLYITTAYAKISLAGDIIVDSIHLDEKLALPYLNGTYSRGESMYVPIIPQYKRIDMTINGTETSLEYKDILGGTSIRLAGPSTTTLITKSQDPIREAGATTSTNTYSIATADGMMKAVFTQTANGNVWIKNSYMIRDPPPPPLPALLDPLDATVNIYVNGERKKTINLGINADPDASKDAKSKDVGGRFNKKLVTRTVNYDYSSFVFSGNAQIPVEAGDFVEFHVITRILGEIDRYTPPAGKIIEEDWGESRATVNIESASIQTSM